MQTAMLAAVYCFVAVAIETLGEEASSFFRDLGHRSVAVTSESCPLQSLLQQLNVAVQRGNVICMLGTVPASKKLDYVLFLQFSF